MTGALVQFHVDQVTLDVDLSEAEAQRLAPVLQAAFEDLAKRLQSSPTSRWKNSTRLALAELCIDAVPTDELLGPRGAARLADAFWRQLIASGSTI